MMTAENQITLPDGRTLAYAEFGGRDGLPVLYFHGSPSSRLEPLLVGDQTWKSLGLRIIAPDRPGIGGSSFQPNRGFSDWPKDVLALADSLGLDQFSILGNSGGGMYVAVCAAKIPQRLRRAVIVSGGWRMNWPEAKAGMPFMNRLVMNFAAHAPPLLRLLYRAMASAKRPTREKELAQLQARMPRADFEAFAQGDRIDVLHRVIGECMRQGTRGPVWDMRLYVKPFDFPLGEIRFPIKLFHGEEDVNAPIAMVRRALTQIPSALLKTFANEAHFSLLCNHVEEIAQACV
jgi:pimeloyl-ACP methyl ester carboxylesterase